MATKTDLRTLVRELFDIGVRAADPAAAVNDALRREPLDRPKSGRYFVVAIGKAACPMAEAALAHVPPGTPVTAMAVTNYENVRDVAGCTVLGAGHPNPDENGLRAGRLVLHLLMAAGANDHVLCLISGGGSALLPAPLPGIALADKIRVNELMLANGLDITETNLVRQQLSLLKGGGLARFAAPATIRTLAVSDVIGDDPRAIASGPTASPLGSLSDATNVLQKRGIWNELPESVHAVLTDSVSPAQQLKAANDIAVICSNKISLEAIANAAGDCSPQIVSGRLNGDVAQAAGKISDFVRQSRTGSNRLLIWGGETTVNLTGTGKGGRNQELALRFALQNEDLPGEWVFLACGTDGRDGPTDAAGGIVDRGTAERVRKARGRPEMLLTNNDSNTALHLAGDLLVCGATGTNVADVALFLRA